MSSLFWDLIDELILSSEIVIDRPNRISIPPIDYGYLSGTSGGDGQEIDVWQGSVGRTHVDAIVCTVDLRKRDTEIKILVGCSDDEKKSICDYHASNRTSAPLVQRN